MLVVLAIFVPFTTETIKYYKYMASHAPEGYKWPDFDAFWLTGVTMVLTLALEKIIEALFYPLFLKACKE